MNTQTKIIFALSISFFSSTLISADFFSNLNLEKQTLSHYLNIERNKLNIQYQTKLRHTKHTIQLIFKFEHLFFTNSSFSKNNERDCQHLDKLLFEDFLLSEEKPLARSPFDVCSYKELGDKSNYFVSDLREKYNTNMSFLKDIQINERYFFSNLFQDSPDDRNILCFLLSQSPAHLKLYLNEKIISGITTTDSPNQTFSAFFTSWMNIIAANNLYYWQ